MGARQGSSQQGRPPTDGGLVPSLKTTITKAGLILDPGLFSIQLTESDNLDHLYIAIAKESKRTELASCATSGKTFFNETVLTAIFSPVPQKPIALSAVSMNNIDQRALQNGSVGNNNDSPTIEDS